MPNANNAFRTRTEIKGGFLAMKEKVVLAFFDDDLWILLQNKVWRQKLRDYIVEQKLTDDRRLGKIAAEGLGAIAALLFAA